MTGFSQVFRRLRACGAMRVAAAVSLAVQLLVPVVHGQEADFTNAGGRSSVELSASRDNATVAAHDAERCVQCRLASQVRSLALPVLVAAEGVLRPQAFDVARRLEPDAGFALAGASPRAPPRRA